MDTNYVKLDILAIGVHPDDVEISAAATIKKHIDLGMKVGLLDLTKGEMGTRGSADIRMQEAAAAAQMLQVELRETLSMKDSFVCATEENKIEIAKVIRKYRPDIILANAPQDRHPDHSAASQLVVAANFIAGLSKLELQDGKPLEPWRAKNIFHYIQDDYLKPDFVVDISDYFDFKMEVLACYASQFYNPNSQEPETPISSLDFYKYMEARARDMGRKIMKTYGEGFIAQRILNVDSFKGLY